MATAEQIKRMIKAYTEDDRETFRTISLQIAAAEARKGNDRDAADISKAVTRFDESAPLHGKKDEEYPYFRVMLARTGTSTIYVSDENAKALNDIVESFRYRNTFYANGMDYMRKILVTGAPGTGKTEAARYLASKVGYPLTMIPISEIAILEKLRQGQIITDLFHRINNVMGVYLFELSPLAAGSDIQAIMDMIITGINDSYSQSMIILEVPASFDVNPIRHKFDTSISFWNPDKTLIHEIFKGKLGISPAGEKLMGTLVEKADGLSHAAIIKVAEETLRITAISDAESQSE